MSAAEWRQWRRAIFGDPYLVWHDGPEFGGLLNAARADPDTVEAMLAAGLLDCDPVAARSFAALTTAGLEPARSVALLEAAARSASGAFLVSVAAALYQLTGHESWAGPITSVLRTARFWGDRMDAAIALAEFTPTVELVQVLSDAVCDPEYLVRYHAANGLLRYAQARDRSAPGADVYRHPDLFALIASAPGLGRKRWWRRAHSTSAADSARFREAARRLSADALKRLGT